VPWGWFRAGEGTVPGRRFCRHVHATFLPLPTVLANGFGGSSQQHVGGAPFAVTSAEGSGLPVLIHYAPSSQMFSYVGSWHTMLRQGALPPS
jgi:hypothetical protein